MDFDLTERQSFFRDRVREFIDAHVRGRSRGLSQRDRRPATRWQPLKLIEELKPLAQAEGLWNLFMPPGGALQHVDESFDFEGEQLTNLEYALCAEEMGRILWSAEVFNCSAPDTGNMEVLHRYGTRAQKDEWLGPLMRGEIRSAFLMTEPGGRLVRRDQHRMPDRARRRRLCHQRPQMVVVGRGRPALQGRDPDGQDRHRRGQAPPAVDDPGADGRRRASRSSGA